MKRFYKSCLLEGSTTLDVMNKSVRKYSFSKGKTNKSMRSLKNKWSLALLLTIQIILGNFVYGQSAGFNSSFAILSINGGANAYYDLNANTANTDFNNANLGTFNPATQSLILKGAEHNVYKCGASDLTSTRLMYRIYSTSGSGGSFTSLNVPYTSGGNNGCGGQDQQWSLTGNNLNVLSGLAPGSYFLEVYSEATVTNCCGGMVYASNLSANYKATFTVGGNYVLTNSGSGLAATYSTLASAITALNAATITAPVVVTLYGNETAPTAGYSITKSGTVTNTITIQGNGAANTIVTAFGGQTSGVKTDAVFKLVGADYITLQNMRIQENAANTTTAVATNNMTEFGVGIFSASTTDGAQNNTIQNCTISMGSTYQNAMGIYSSSAHSSTNGAQVATATSGTNINNKIYGNTISNVAYGIYILSPANTASILENGWDIGGSSLSTGNTITFGNATTSDIGTTSFSATFPAGITFRNATTGQNVKYNTISSNSLSYAQSGGIGGIVCTNGTSPTGITYTNTFSNNTITLTNTGTTAITGIDFGAGLSTGTFVSSTNNITINQTVSAAVSAAVIGIKASYSSATNTCNSNTIVYNQTTSGTGITSSAFTGIDVSGAGTTLNTLSNSITVNQTTSSTSAVTSAITGIKATTASTTVNIGSSGNGNTITVKQAVTGSGAYGSGAMTYINAAAAHTNLNILYNTVNNTGSNQRSTGITYGISHNGTIGTSLNVANNTVNLNCSAATGPSTFYGTYSNGSSTISNYSIQNNSITLVGFTGSSTIGIYNNDGGSCAKTYNNNTITITGNAATVKGIYSNFGRAIAYSNTFDLLSGSTSPTLMNGIEIASSSTSAEVMSAYSNIFTKLNFNGVFSNSPTINGISLAIGTGNTIYGNDIKNITAGAATSTGNPIVNGILISGGVSSSVYQNKIYSLASNCSGSTGLVSGISITGGTTNTVYNNRIGDLTAPASTNADGVRGINITSTSATTTQNIYFNTINLFGTSSAGTFGSSGIFHTTSGTATTSSLDLRNNNIVNTMTPKGSALAVAYRRSSTTLTNYPTTANNNNFFGTSGLFTDGTNTYTTLANYKTVMSTRDQVSQNVNPTFLSTTGSSADFLKINPNSNTAGLEGGAQVIATYTTDFDGDTRNVSTPDIGADEFIALVTCASTPSPTSGTTDVVLSPTLSWAAATNAAGYDVYLGTTSGSLTLVSTNQAGLSYSPSTALSPSTVYYWKIVPRNGSNYASGCTEWSFTTQAATPTLSATSLTSFTNQCINTTSSANSFNLSGVYLTTADITVGPLSGFAFSATSNGTYSSTLTISQSGGTLASTPVFVQFTPTSATSFNGNIPVTGGGVSAAISVAVAATGVNTPATAATGSSSAITASTATVAGSFVANCQTITAYGIEYSTTNGFSNGSGTQVASTNQSSGSFTSSLSGLINNTTYYYKAYATYGGTTVYGTQSSFTTPQICSIALQETFPTTTLPTGWTNSSFLFTTATGVPAFTSNYMRVNLYSSVTTANFSTCNYGPVGTNASLTFNYSVTNWAASTAPASGWGNIQVQISTDFGVTYTTINTITTSSASVTPVSISLSSYAGQYAKFRFLATWATGDYNVVIDDINAIAPCSAPNQPTNLTFTNVGPAQMTVNYTASTSSPSGYMILRYPAGDTPTSPVDGTTYTAGTTLGTGTVAYVGASLSNVISGLTVNTNYDFYVYGYNAVTCTNGPVYNTNSPLSGTQSTTGCPTLSSVITIGAGYDYTTLTDALVILNGCGITQPTTLELQSNYVSTSEAFPISLGSITGASATNTITIRPAAGVSSSLTISSSNATGTINHNGGNYFIIDGRPGSAGTSKFITIENTSSSGYVINYQNEASNNTLRYLTIKGQNTSTTSGTIVFSTTTGANGNDNNTVEYNDICAVNASTATPTNAIYAAGTTTTSIANNSNNSISNNTIRDFYNSSSTTNGGSGINIVTGNTDWIISNNSIFQTQSRTTYGAGAPIFAIFINNTAGNNFTVSSNTIGGTSVNAGGTAMTINASTTALMRLIYISVGVTTSSSISNNIVKNISFTTTSASSVNGLISILNGAVNCSNNVLGDASVSNSIVFNTSAGAMFSGIGAGTGTTGQGLITLSGNTIAGIAVGGGGTCELRAITFQSSGITASTQYTVSNNTIGSSAITNSLSNSNNSAVYGIIGTANQTTSTNTLSGNTIAGIQSTSTGASASVYGILAQGNLGGRYNTSGNSIFKLQSSGGSIVSGIYHTAATTNDQVIASNNVNELSYTGTGTSSVLGIYYSGPTAGTNEIKSNLVHSLSAATAGSTLTGIQVADAGNALIYNNMIRLGINAAGSAVTTNALVYGINQSGASSNHGIYFNSIYVGGTGVVTGANNTFALHSAATSGTRNIRNNIFSNARGNGVGTGKHYAIRIAGLTGLTINNNDYWTGASFLALNNATDVTSFANWQTATSQDAGSLSNDPNFINPTGNSTSFDLHINNSTSSVLESGGVNIPGIATDRDGDTRPGPTSSSNGGGISSDIGADEFDGIPGYTCSTFPALAAVTTNATVCGGTQATLSITGTISGTGITYQWKSAATQTGTNANISGATGSTYTVPMASVSNLWYVCDVTCANGSSTTTSSVNVQVLACNYTTARNTGISYNSIMSSGSTYSSLSGADDGYTNSVNLTGTTFKYRGAAITGFVATTNGWMTFNTANTNTTYTNDLTSSINTNVLAPLWDDLVIKGTDIANKDLSMKYQIVGTLGSGSADIIIEWAEMERYLYGDPNVNFQIVLHESDNSIDYNYGNFQMFNGATNGSTWSYSVGLNGTAPATNSTDQRIILQAENSNYFNSTLQNSLAYSILCNSQIKFSPSVSFNSGSAPTSGSFTASTFAPVNNETAGAITLSVNGSPCTSNCGNIYSSKNATSTNGMAACTATTPGSADDDVFFKFTTSSVTNFRLAVDPSAGYNAVVQVLDASFNPVACINDAGAGLSELITSLTLNASSLYYIRIYDAAAGATNNGEFAICISEVIAPPVNDEPAGAISLTSGVSCSATSSIQPATLSATATSGVTGCSATTPGTADDDIWYTFTTNSIAGTTYAITATGVSTYNAVLQLYSGTVGNLVSMNCVNSTGNGGVETINAGALSTNTTYYLRVYHSGTGAANGNVSICVVHTLPSCLTSTTTATNDYVWQGQTTDWNAASNWLIYNGPSSYSVASSAPTNVNVIIPSSTCFANQPVVVSTPSTVNNLSVLSGATLALGSNTLSITGDMTVAGTFTPGTGTVNFIGNGTQIVTMGSQAFNHVTINGFGTVQLAGNTTINGNYTSNSGSLDLNNFNLTMGGNYSNYNSMSGLLPGTGAVVFNKASGTQTVDQLALDFFTVRHTGAGTLQLLSDLSATGNIVNTAGIIDGNGKIITIKGNFNNTATFNAGAGGQIIFEKDGGNQTLTAGTAVFEKLVHQVPVGGTASTLNLSGIVEVKGDVVIDAPISTGTSTLKLSGTGNQTMSGTQSVIALKDMTVAKTAGTVTLSKPVRVDGALTMTQGNIITSATNKLEIGSSTSALGSVNWTSGNVVGPMRRWFAGATNSTAASGMFPVGLSTVNRYAQVNFTQAPGSGGYIEMEYKAGVPTTQTPWTYLTTPDGQLIQTFEDEGYWDITPYDESGNAYPSGLNTSAFTMKLRANGLTSVNDITITRIIRSPGPLHTTWEPAGFHLAATGTSSDFAIESNTVTGFSWFNIGSPNNNALPVELLNFNGTCEEGMVDLLWQTASEFNSSHFDVEKSTDGETWRVMATVPSAGTSNELLTYQAMDNSGTNGSNYYRLRQVDNDGKEKLYDPINVSCVETTAGYFTSYPNPSGNEFQVVVNNKEILGACTLNIVDVHGKVIDQRSIDMKEGINMFVMTEMLNPGIYFLNITNGTKSTQVIKHAVK